MMTTTDESSLTKNASSLSSSDLVSRFLAATPPYLYNVPPTQHNFFFSEMLRSFVQAKNDSIALRSTGIRRRKRTWRDLHDRPLELTTKENNRNHEPTIHTSASQYHQHYQQHQTNPVQQEQHQNHLQSHQYLEENNTVTEIKDRKYYHHEADHLKNVHDNEFQSKTEEKNINFVERIALNSPNETLFSPDLEKVKIDESHNIKSKNIYNDNNFLHNCTKSSIDNLCFIEQKNKSDLTPKKFFPNIANRIDDIQRISNFSRPHSATTNFFPTPLWYPPYPLSQTYPAIDPLHFFIDLRVSGHIWDRQSNDKHTFTNRNKHNSAFNVPLIKEYNRPLNLTRTDQSSVNRYESKNLKGTHYIFKNIKETYKKIWELEHFSRSNASNEDFDEVPEAQTISRKRDEERSSPFHSQN